MTAYNLLILDKMIQHHYETNAVIRPTQEEVETALIHITNEIDDLKRLNAELLITVKAVKGMLKDEHMKNEWYDRGKRIEEIEQVIDGTINTVERHIR